jgi:hypothetical protein
LYYTTKRVGLYISNSVFHLNEENNIKKVLKKIIYSWKLREGAISERYALSAMSPPFPVAIWMFCSLSLLCFYVEMNFEVVR